MQYPKVLFICSGCKGEVAILSGSRTGANVDNNVKAPEEGGLTGTGWARVPLRHT